ncbi:hypothetical protein HC928_17890 [bacterium]|nr:hypothetical protein [bacterium]
MRGRRDDGAELAERVGFKWAMASGSLMTGKGVRPFMKEFFNTLRPRPRQLSEL